MQKQLEIKHLAAYFPYGLKIQIEEKIYVASVLSIGLNGFMYIEGRRRENGYWRKNGKELRNQKELAFKPILRPLDLS